MKYFFVRGFEIGASQAGFLQYDNAGVWTNVGPFVCNNTSIVCNSHYNPIPVDFNIFVPGQTYCFRLVDKVGDPISNVICIGIPNSDQNLQNVDDVDLLNLDNQPLKNL